MRLALLVDLDGTIVDSIDWHEKVGRETSKTLGIDIQDRAFESYATFFDYTERRPGVFGDSFRDEYNRRALELMHLTEVGVYCDAIPFLESFAGHGRALVTNRPVVQTRSLVNHLGLEGFFDVVECGVPGAFEKPDPRIGMSALRKIGRYDAVAVVGDAKIDMELAHNLSKIVHVPVEGYLVDRIRYFDGNIPFGHKASGLDEARTGIERLLQGSKH